MPRTRPPVARVIDIWAPKYGLDPRAVKVVAGGEGGLKWGAVGDAGTSYGPFQLHEGGALPAGRGAAWANSPAGVKYALRKMAESGARGQTGMQAAETIIRQFERPADPNASVAGARQRWKDWGMGTIKGGNIPNSGPLDNPTYGHGGPATGDGRRQQMFNYAMASLQSYINEGEAPDITEFLKPVMDEMGHVPGAVTDSKLHTGVMKGTSYKGAKGAKAMIAAIRRAQKMGLSVRENPFVDKVDPVHTEGSHHYQNFQGTNVGKAIDVSGPPAKQRAYFLWLEANRQRLGLNDLFYDPMGYSYDQGKRWGKTIGGHGDHVHASIF